MRILVFNLATDADHPYWGFTIRWIDALARRVQRVVVITMGVGRHDLPANVHVLSAGRERGYGRIRRVAEFYRHLSSVLAREPIDACFAHMMLIFPLLAAPLLKIRRIPLVTWYAHPHRSRILQIVHQLSDRVVSSIPGAYPYHRDRLILLGAGIDTEFFAPDGSRPAEPPLILCAGRLSAVKNHPILFHAIALLRNRGGPPFRAVILGGPAAQQDEIYVKSLHELARELELESVVRFEGPRPPSELPSWYRRAMVHVNLTGTGFADKVALEAMACGCPCLVANDSIGETLGAYADRLLLRHLSPDALADRLAWALSLGSEGRDSVGGYLRAQVVRQHSLDGLADGLISVLGQVSRKK